MRSFTGRFAKSTGLLIGVLAGFGLGLNVGPDQSANAAEYYKGKTFTVMVASRPGGGTDTTGRLVARFWSRHIPGTPDIVVRNKPLQLIGANDLTHKVRPNGLTVGVFAGAGSLGPVARKSSAVRYDPTKWGFVGAVERGPSLQLVRKSAMKNLMDPNAKPIAMGSVSSDRTQDAIAVFGAEYLGWNLKFVLGYPNSSAIYLAFGRGEIDMFGSGTTKILNRFINDEGAVPVSAQTRRADFPNVVTFDELLGAKKPTGDKWAAFQAWTGPSNVDKYFAVTKGTPKNLLKTLQVSFKATTNDPDFIKAARNILGTGYSILSPAETARLVAGAITISPGALKEIVRLRKKYNLPKVSRKAAKVVAVTFDKVQRGGRVLLFKHKGKAMKLRVSGSRSEITFSGKIAPRSALKPGMTCFVNWKKRGDRVEANTVKCLSKVTFDKVQRDGRILRFKHDGKKMKLRVSGSRSEITVAGQLAGRSSLKTGMTCNLSWAKRGDRIEARKVICP
ncbi:MAG: hypothetical protein HOF95_08155 [Rhodospirillales bacterium]|jgi:tripartite-type tricarboxylate transporter receptor subunit TctC|nr:hypothetical protein [Rhodospirillales bacterium]MBT4007306.1 hypothetical protein [Rhodospirillales bacterium]MBT5076989.1 hypothetical protein [Rhodospirillales bacterium]MBT5113639.1 hypothetical protein [Rhodospirillales bacterium]MBT5673937.1 hypothetical protein [Rhodospirillales bacterium]